MPYDDEEHQCEEKEHQREEEEEGEEEEHLTTVKHILQDAKMLFIGLHDNGGRQF